jgi:multidrug efflux pump subunit AcrA (membrane-fusion protein)
VAPFDGIIVEVDVKQGEQVQRGAALAYLERT